MKFRITFKVKLGQLSGGRLQFERRTLAEEVEFDHDPADDEIRDAIEKRYTHSTFQDFEIVEREVLTP